MRLPRRQFIKRGALFVPFIFVPKLIRAQMATLPGGMIARRAAAAAPTPDILWWKLNDGSGTTITGDGSNGGDDATTSASWVTGKSGSGFALDYIPAGSDESKSAANITYGINIITMCGWVWLDDSTTLQMLWYAPGETGTDENRAYTYIVSGAIGSVVQGTGAGYRAEAAIAPATGAWFHLAVVADGSTTAGDIKIYFNGVDQSTTLDTETKAGTSNFASKRFTAGSLGDAASWLFDGRMDDVRIYSGDKSADLAAIMADVQ